MIIFQRLLFFFQIIKLTILHNKIVDYSISLITKFWSGFFFNKICQESLIFVFLFVIYLKFISFDIFEILKSFQKFMFHDSIDCINKEFVVIDCFWDSRNHKSTINKCDESDSYKSSQTETTDIKKNKNNTWRLILINKVFEEITEVTNFKTSL